MATRKALLASLALARDKKAEKREATTRIEAPVPREPAKAPDMGVITNPQRMIAKECTDQAMLVGWDRAIQKTAYEAGISEQTMRQILDAALDYEDKADPAGRIEGLEDWRNEKRGSSELASPRRR